MFGMFVCLCLCMTLSPGLLISASPDLDWNNYDQSTLAENCKQPISCCQTSVRQEPIVTLAELQKYCMETGESLVVAVCCQAVFKGQRLREYANTFLIET